MIHDARLVGLFERQARGLADLRADGQAGGGGECFDFRELFVRDSESKGAHRPCCRRRCAGLSRRRKCNGPHPRALRRLGEPVRRRARGARPTRTGVVSLTERELQIARLTGDRLTNREIGRRLFLSEKTIEAHMRISCSIYL